MARRQDAAGRGGTGGGLSRRFAVLVHDRFEAEAALALAEAEGIAIELVIPVGIAGPAFARALEERLGQPLTALCDDRAGLALEALRTGLRHLVFTGPPDQAERLSDIARAEGGSLRRQVPLPLHLIDTQGRRFTVSEHAAGLGSTTDPVP